MSNLNVFYSEYKIIEVQASCDILNTVLCNQVFSTGDYRSLREIYTYLSADKFLTEIERNRRVQIVCTTDTLFLTIWHSLCYYFYYCILDYQIIWKSLNIHVHVFQTFARKIWYSDTTRKFLFFSHMHASSIFWYFTVFYEINIFKMFLV